jgi:hypothetical protein
MLLGLPRKQNRAPALRALPLSAHEVESREEQSTAGCSRDAGRGRLGSRPHALWRRPPPPPPHPRSPGCMGAAEVLIKRPGIASASLAPARTAATGPRLCNQICIFRHFTAHAEGKKFVVIGGTVLESVVGGRQGSARSPSPKQKSDRRGHARRSTPAASRRCGSRFWVNWRLRGCFPLDFRPLC